MAEFLAILATAATGIGACWAFYEATLALRAKKRAYWLLCTKVRDHAELQQMMAFHTFRINSEEEERRAVREIEAALANDLEPRDKKFVLEGLHQSNRVGAQRYMKEVLTGT